MEFVKATKSQSKLRLALCGLAGSGKTWTMLAIATAMAAEMRRLGHGAGRIALIDTEHESASLYADHFDFDTLPLDDHSPRQYVAAIRLAEDRGYDFCIVDSLSHAWTGKNGALEQKDNAAARGGNSWTAWRDITPMHNTLVDTMLACRMHLLASMRTKMEYIQTTGANGKQTIEKVGLAAIQREGMEYEFTAVGDMELSNLHVLTVAKTRIHGVLNIGDKHEHPGRDLALKIYGWLMSGAAPAPRPVAAAPVVADVVVDKLNAIELASTVEDLQALIPTLATLTGAALVEGRRRYNARNAKLMAEAVDRANAAPANEALGQLVDTGRAVLDRMDASDAAADRAVSEMTATPAEERSFLASKEPEERVRNTGPEAA